MVKTTLARVYVSDNNKLKRLAKKKKTTTANILHGLLKNKRGIVNSLIAVFFALFLFAIFSALALRVWGDFNEGVQSLDESVADNSTKAQIQSLGDYVGWADKLFTFFIVTLIIGLLVTSFTLPAESYWFLILYFGVLILVTLVSMFLSNTWTVLINDPSLVSTLPSLSFTDFILRTFPYVVFFTGLLSGLIFYLRAKSTPSVAGFGGEDF
jgi:hypothetical protein